MNPGAMIQSSKARERRRAPRYDCHGPIDFRIEGWYLRRGRILDICLNGCLLQPHLKTDCDPGDHLDLRFQVKGLTFRAYCIVRRTQSTGAIGVEILSLSERGRHQLKQLLEELALPSQEP
jgi:hypothetical protein